MKRSEKNITWNLTAVILIFAIIIFLKFNSDAFANYFINALMG